MAENKKLTAKKAGRGGGAYGAVLGLQTPVYCDDTLGLIEAGPGEVEGGSGYQSSSSARDYSWSSQHSRSSGGKRSFDSTYEAEFGSGHHKGSRTSSSSQHTSRSASNRSSVASYKITTKEGTYDLWRGHTRRGSVSSTDSGSSDEVYSRTSSSSSSTHCHDIVTEAPEDKLPLVKLSVAAFLSLLFTLLEYVGGYYSSSLAVLSSAGHLMSDFCGFVVSLAAMWLVRRPPSTTMNFGYYRAEVLGSVASVLVVWVVTGLLVGAAVQRLLNQPFTLDPDVMLLMASVAIAVNISIALILHGCGCHGYFHGAQKSTKSKSLNMRAALVHFVADILQTLAVLVAAIIVKIWPQYQIADPILTFVFGFIVVVTTLPIIRELAHILMQGAPRNVNYLTLLNDLEGLPGVRTVHNLHIWSLTLDKNALSVHLGIDQSFDAETVLDEAQRLILKNYLVYNSTIQIERYAREMDTCKKCQTPVR
ncbi:zinc transporter 2-like isoform X2 [Portunus trituberculatus]|uniref:zinc transporter 2-like isoform X2 n=1 Tax=Portunus trituberculatus TaxID=210409 RepID=UPI001E1CF21D|nr:zinc transporter 2-like isoform X2 [Portunus trituberculatus]